MADVTYSFKLDTDTKEQLASLVEQSGCTAKDFLVRLIASYQTTQAQEDLSQVKELRQMEHHLTRVREIYVSMAKAAQDQQESDTFTISQVQAELQESKAATLDAQTNLAQLAQDSEARVQSAELAMALASEESQKEILFLQGALREAQESREQAARLATLAERAVSEAETKITELKSQLDQTVTIQQQLAQLRLEKDELDRKLTILRGEFQRSKEQSDTDIQRIQERAALDQERAVLAAQREAMQEIGRLRDALAEAREEKALLKSELSQRENIAKAKRGRPAESK